MLRREKQLVRLPSHAVLLLSTICFLASDAVAQAPFSQGGVSTVISDTTPVIQDQPVAPPVVQQEAAAAPAGCGTSDPDVSCDCCRPLIGTGDDAIIQLGGWASFGYHDGPGNGLFNNHPNRLNAHQIWFFAERAAEREMCQIDWGFRFDAVYGVDGADTQAFGNPAGSWDFANGFDHGQFSWALPQAYLELGFNDTSIKVGHFYTLIGYEVVTAPDNFFYSHAITMYNSEPFTHTGVLVERSLGEDVTVYGGYTLGWDTGFDQTNDGSSFLGGISFGVCDHTTITYISTVGNFGLRSAGQNGYSHSVVIDTRLTDRLNYVVQSDALRVANTGEDNIGLNQYLIMEVNDCLSLGARMEWWKGDDVTGYSPFGSTVGPGSHSYYEATFGANIAVSDSLMVRPEYRYDWSPALGYNESTVGVDFVITPQFN